MVVKIFTREDAPEMREAKELGARLEDQDFEVEYLDADDAAATSRIELYDVYSYPTFVVAEDNGSEVECWRSKIPMESDIKQFLQG